MPMHAQAFAGNPDGSPSEVKLFEESRLNFLALVFCLMVGAAIGLGSILTPYATGPSPIYYGSGYLPTADYWRLGAIFGLIFLVLLVITGLLWMPVVLL